MRSLFVIIAVVCFGQVSFGQAGGVPGHYRQIAEVFGDLDKDSIPERVVVYNMSDKEDELKGVDRELIIFKKDKEHWRIWQRSTNAIGNSKDGGMMGDPFEDLDVENGILLIYQSGGSSWKWGHTDKYRYQHGRFELIGYTSMYGKPCEYWESFDFNLMTGNINVDKEYEKCDDDDKQTVYKKEHERFNHRLKQKITLQDRMKSEVKIISPRYKHELYL